MPRSRYWHAALYKVLGAYGPLALCHYQVLFHDLPQGVGQILSAQVLGGGGGGWGGKWNKSAQCVRKHAHLGGSAGHAPPGTF